MKKAIMLSENDNIATVLEDVYINDNIEVRNLNKKIVIVIKALSNINLGHKISIKNIQVNEKIIKYSHVIGKVTSTIGVGELVHIHNLESLRGRGDLA